ncbi:MAG: hypothetical protein KDK70_24645 [Myxococcales bacterium]|nr:hypothetical protein [Myxococcales bacterium]
MVQLRARIPGLPEVSLASDEVPVVLDCTVADDGGADGSGTAGDGTAGTGGASATDDGGQDMDPGGCSCRSTAEPWPEPGARLGLLLLLRRRRRDSIHGTVGRNSLA